MEKENLESGVTISPVHVLLAEDNPVNLKLVTLMLSKAGHTVEVATNGKEVVQKYVEGSDRFDIILMDVQMPEMDGLEATGRIREWEEGNSPLGALVQETLNAVDLGSPS